MIFDYLMALLDWCKVKLFLWDKKSDVQFKEGAVWWCSVGVNVGVEILGKGKNFERPILIFKKFGQNSFLGIPLTTQLKNGTWYVSTIVREKEGRAALNQIRVFDKKRLINKIGTLGSENFLEIKMAFLNLYGS
jgi:mRNA interferase MazF